MLDFGISKSVLSSPLTTCHTGAWLADVHVAGADPVLAHRRSPHRHLVARHLLYELLTGDPPFDGDTFRGVAFKVVHEPLPRLSVPVPSGLDEVVHRCLEKRPQDCYTTVADLAAALSPFFVEGVPWAVRVQRTLAHAPEPTQMGDDPARSATMTPQPPASTTNFTAGESLARQLPRRKLWPWLAGIGVAAVTATVLAIVLPGGDDSKPARPAGEPRPADIAAPPKPEVKPIDTGGSGSAGSDVGSVGSGGSGSDHTNRVRRHDRPRRLRHAQASRSSQAAGRRPQPAGPREPAGGAQRPARQPARRLGPRSERLGEPVRRFRRDDRAQAAARRQRQRDPDEAAGHGEEAVPPRRSDLRIVTAGFAGRRNLPFASPRILAPIRWPWGCSMPGACAISSLSCS